jgi:hypothetical protein
MQKINRLFKDLAITNEDQSLILSLQNKFPEKIKCYSLPSTFVSGKSGVDIETQTGAVTVVWKIDLGDPKKSIFSICILKGCSKEFKSNYLKVFKNKYTELSGINGVYDAVNKIIMM